MSRGARVLIITGLMAAMAATFVYMVTIDHFARGCLVYHTQRTFVHVWRDLKFCDQWRSQGGTQ